MPDWNPAEIIGIRPNRLAADLYNHQIMNSAWAAQRSEYGYRDVRPFGLMKFSVDSLTLILEQVSILLFQKI